MKNILKIRFLGFVQILLILGHVGLCEESKSVPLNLSYDVYVNESIVESNGMKYRKIEYKGKVFTLQLLNPESSTQDLAFRCNDARKGQVDLPNQVVISQKITKRSSLFVDGLRNTCVSGSHGNRVAVDPNIRIGFLIGDSKEDARVFKNKKIFIAPFSNILGFSADW